MGGGRRGDPEDTCSSSLQPPQHLCREQLWLFERAPPAPHGRPFAPLLAAASTKTILASSFFFPQPQWPQRSLKARSRGTKWRNKNEARGAYRTCLSPGSWKDPRQRDILNNKFCDFTYLLELC